MKLSEVNKVAEREFGEQPSSVEEIEEGLKQETYRLEIGDENYILQLSNKIGDSENGLERNITAYQLLKRTEVPVPDFVTSELNRYKNNSEEWKYYIAECLP